MKFVLLCLALWPAISQAASVEQIDIQKTLDGGTAYCQAERDLGRAAYRPRKLRVEAADGQLRLDLEVEFLLCQGAGRSFYWTPRSPLAPTPSHDGRGREIEILYSEVESLLVSARYQPLAILATGSGSVQNLQFDFPIERALSEAQLGELERGQPVRVRADYFQRAVVRVRTPDGIVNTGWGAGGAYAVMFTLVKGADGLEVSALEVR